MHTALKKRIIHSIEILPFGHDLYLRLAGSRLGITYRGVFDSCSQAQSAVPARVVTDYDIINEVKGEKLEQELPIIDKRVLDIDYPLLFWLFRLSKPAQRILELGGSIGQSFYSFEDYFPYPDNIQWVIAELPAAVDAGQKAAKQLQEARLSFIDSRHMDQELPADIFVTAGTLQYMDTTIPEVLGQLRELPEHVLIHNLPAHPSQDFWTLQNLEVCEVPYHIHSWGRIVSAMANAGYTLMDKWKNPRQIEIPYHLEKRVEFYYGFYFRKTRDGVTASVSRHEVPL